MQQKSISFNLSWINVIGQCQNVIIQRIMSSLKCKQYERPKISKNLDPFFKNECICAQLVLIIK